MNLYNDNNERRKIIMKHYSSPLNKKDISNFTLKQDGYSKTCVDEVHLGFTIKNNKIIEMNFDGKGCAVFISATDILISQIKNKTWGEIETMIHDFLDLVEQKQAYIDYVGELNVFSNVATHLNRKACAILTAETILKIVNQYKQKS